MQNFEIINSKSVTPALSNRFQVHTAGCPDLDKYRTRKRTVIKKREAPTVVLCVMQEVKRSKNNPLSLRDFDVMPCCNGKAPSPLPVPNLNNRSLNMAKKDSKKKFKLDSKKKDKKAKTPKDTAGRAAAKEAKRKARIEKTMLRMAKQIARLQKLGVDEKVVGKISAAMAAVKA